jgi:hypothetical protein
MLLPRTTEDLHRLTRYLADSGLVHHAVISIDAKWSQEEDKRNIEDPRGFCHTVQDKTIIYCSRALEDVDREVRVGVLIHEIGHIVLGAFDGEESEVDVDAWVSGILKPGTYCYLQTYSYMNSLIEEQVKAMNIQRVTTAFLRELDK